MTVSHETAFLLREAGFPQLSEDGWIRVPMFDSIWAELPETINSNSFGWSCAMLTLTKNSISYADKGVIPYRADLTDFDNNVAEAAAALYLLLKANKLI